MAADAGFSVRRITLLHPAGTVAVVVLRAPEGGPAHVNLAAHRRVVARFASAGNAFTREIARGWACHRAAFEPAPADSVLCRAR